MKNFTLIFNIVITTAIAALFYLHFSASKNAQPIKLSQKNAEGKGVKIGYFEPDSLQNNFEYYKQIIKELGLSEQQKRSELASKENAYMAKAREYQEKGQSMTQAEVAKAQQDMAQREKDYQLSKQAKAQEMEDESFKKRQDVKKKIEDFLKEYNKDNTYSFIIANSPDLIYYKDTMYDITKDLIKGLNEKYKKKD